MLHRAVTLAMVLGEPTLVFWRIEDLLEALQASCDMGLPLTRPPEISDEIINRLFRALLEDDPADLADPDSP